LFGKVNDAVGNGMGKMARIGLAADDDQIIVALARFGEDRFGNPALA
jgi:hypothetical protein